MATKSFLQQTSSLRQRTLWILFIFSLGLMQPLSAQCWQWANSAGGTSMESPTSIAVGPGGTMAITGEFMGNAVIGNDTLLAVNGREVFTAILDSSGSIMRGLSGVGSGLENIGTGVGADGQGNFFVTGNFTDTIAFDGVSLNSAGQGDIFLVKYDSSGHLLWGKRAGGSNDINVHDLAVDAIGNSYLVGEFYDSVSFGNQVIYSTVGLDVFTAKFDPNGNALWAASCGSVSSDIGSGIAVDAQGSVYITGYFQSQFVFNNLPYTSEGNRDVFVAKYDANGNPLWASVGGGPGNDFLNRIAVDKRGNHLYVCGEFESDSFLVGGITLLNKNSSVPRGDIFFLQYQTDGLLQWGHSTGSMEHDYAYDLAVDEKGDVYITGTFADSIAFGDTLLNSGYSDLFVTKYDSTGTHLWALTPTYNHALGASYAIGTFQNRPVISGDFILGTGFSTVAFGEDTLASNGSIDFFVAQVDPLCGSPSTGIEDLAGEGLSLQVFPNPFFESVFVQLEAPKPEWMELRLLRIDGGMIWFERYQWPGEIHFSGSHLAAGVYILQILTPQSRQSIRLVKVQG